MGLGIFVMVIIILINLAVVAAVMYYGAQHDPHTDIRSPESSRSVQTLVMQAEKRAQRLEELANQQRTAQLDTGAAAQQGAGAVSNQLGDEEARAKRRAEALARKAARQAQQASSSES